jgi:hypothetical protein
MSESIQSYEKDHQSNKSSENRNHNEDEASKDDDGSSRFIIKRTEPSDIFYFTNPMYKESKEEKLTLGYNTFFNIKDIEVAYEISTFSITVIDQNDNNQIVGIFIFNDTPFALIKLDEPDPALPENPGLWEEWFHTYFTEQKINPKQCLWLIYFVLDKKYIEDDKSLEKIFLKVHLSLYTTLSSYDSVLFLLSKAQNQEIESYIKPNEEEKNEEGNDPEADVKISFRALGTIQSMVNYIYDIIKEKPADKDNNYVSYINRRVVVFPIIEIRMGNEYDHDDLENIFKDQTPPETTNQFEDFFIAKLIANQDEDNKVLVGQVNDKAIGMLSISTDINVNFLIKNFELETYDNLLKPDYMEAVNYKRQLLAEEKNKKIEFEKKRIQHEYEQEITKCEKISQRILLQKYIIKKADFINVVDEIEKTVSSKDDLNEKMAKDLINGILKEYKIIYPELEKFEGKIKITKGECLLSTEFDFFIETLEFFGLPHGYMEKKGHWLDWLEKEAKKREQKEQFRKKLGPTSKAIHKRRDKKENEEPIKPSYFDFSPLGKAMRLLKDANITVRSWLRRVVKENKNLIASFFVDENGEPSDKKCFDIMLLTKKLAKAGIAVPQNYSDKIGPILLCFGGIPYEIREVERIPEPEAVELVVLKKEKKKRKKKEEKDEENEKKVEKPVKVKAYEVNISDFFKAIETTFKYDKVMYELNEIDDPDFKKEYDEYMENEKKKYEETLKQEKSIYQQIEEKNKKKNEKASLASYEKYKEILENYNDENSIPPTPNEIINAFCVKLFFIEQAFESRSSDFLLKVFDQFPEKDYLVLTQPHSFIENSLLENFIKINKKVDSLFGEILFIIHRESLMISLLNVNFATEKDLEEASYLFEDLGPQRAYMYDLALYSIRNSNSKFMCVVCKIKNSIIGISLLSKEVNIDYYDSHFSIRDYINLDKISKYFHSRIIFFESHKNFVQYTKVIFTEILKLINKIAIYYEITPDAEVVPKFFKDFILTHNRKFPHFIMKQWNYKKEQFEDEKIKTRTDGEERDDLDEKESDFCLVYLSKKMLVESRIANNNRIVIIGASDTGISFIESLLSIRYLEFSYIYLVAPGGLLYHHIEKEIDNMKVSINNYQLKELKKLLLEKRIKIINAIVKDIKPKQKYIQFMDDTILNYDYLILTLGLQDHLWKDLSAVCHKSIEEKFEIIRDNFEKDTKDKEKPENTNMKEYEAILNAFKTIKEEMKKQILEMVFSIDDPKIYEEFAITNQKLVSLRKNPHYKILLYGRNLNLLCFIQGLLRRNVPPSKIKVVIPSIKFDMTTSQKQKDERKRREKGKDNEYDNNLEFINGNSMENCKDVEKFIIKVMREKGIEIYENYNFSGVKLKREEFTENIKQELQDLVIESFKFVEDGKEGEVFISCNLIVTGGMLDVDPTVFDFIHNNGLVYNGRAIINNQFLTADNFIFAAGKLCEFSQCYSYIEKYKQLRLECYNSQEVGYTLAKYFLQTIDSQLNVDASAFDDKKLPSFYLPLPLGCYLPDDYIFYKAKSAKETNPYISGKELNRQPLIYNTLEKGGCYLSFSFNIFGIIDSVVYLGKKQIDYRALVSLVGLHETYLDKLLNRFEGELISDIPEFLSENWALALYHDKFSQLVINLKAILHEKDIFDIVSDVVGKEKPLDRVVINEILGMVGKRTKAKIEYEIVNFLNENRNHLPFYHIPFLQPPEDSPPTNDDEEEKDGNINMEDGEENVKNIEVGIETRDNKSVKSKNSKENSRHSSAGSKKSENK